MIHPLHKTVAEAIACVIQPPCEILLDEACGGDQHLPLFVGGLKKRANAICNVDLLVLRGDLIKVIVEIDKIIKPTQICGKFLTSALGSHYVHTRRKNLPLGKSHTGLFLQIAATLDLPKKTVKGVQFQQLREAIQSILPLGCITRYEIFHGDSAGIAQAADCVQAFCQSA